MLNQINTQWKYVLLVGCQKPIGYSKLFRVNKAKKNIRKYFSLKILAVWKYVSLSLPIFDTHTLVYIFYDLLYKNYITHNTIRINLPLQLNPNYNNYSNNGFPRWTSSFSNKLHTILIKAINICRLKNNTYHILKEDGRIQGSYT